MIFCRVQPDSTPAFAATASSTYIFPFVMAAFVFLCMLGCGVWMMNQPELSFPVEACVIMLLLSDVIWLRVVLVRLFFLRGKKGRVCRGFLLFFPLPHSHFVGGGRARRSRSTSFSPRSRLITTLSPWSCLATRC